MFAPNFLHASVVFGRASGSLPRENQGGYWILVPCLWWNSSLCHPRSQRNPTQDIEAAVAKEQMAIQSVVGNLTLGAIKAMAIQLENCTIPDNTRHRLLRFLSMKMKMGNLTTKNRMFTSPLSLSRRKSSSQNKVKLNCLSFIEQTSLSSGFVGQWFAS